MATKKKPGRFQLVRVAYVPGMESGDTAVIPTAEKMAELMAKSIPCPDRECVVAVHVGPCMNVLGVEIVSIGTDVECNAVPKMLFRGAILNGANRVFVGHNHPNISGKPQLSPEDAQTAAMLKKCGLLLDIDIPDFFVVTYPGGPWTSIVTEFLKST
jgi:DNA repair protein RadC